MLEARPRATSTTIAAVLILLVCIPFIANGFTLYDLITDPASADLELRQALVLARAPADEASTRTFAIFGAIVTLGLCALSFAFALGLLWRRQGAHHAAAITFTVLAMIALSASIAGLTADPPAENARIGFLVGLVNVAIVACLLMPSTQDDIEYAETLRARRRSGLTGARSRVLFRRQKGSSPHP